MAFNLYVKPCSIGAEGAGSDKQKKEVKTAITFTTLN